MEFAQRFLLLGVAIGAIVLGFISLGTGHLSLGPILLVGGYCLVLPFYLWRSFAKSVRD